MRAVEQKPLRGRLHYRLTQSHTVAAKAGFRGKSQKGFFYHDSGSVAQSRDSNGDRDPDRTPDVPVPTTRGLHRGLDRLRYLTGVSSCKSSSTAVPDTRARGQRTIINESPSVCPKAES